MMCASDRLLVPKLYTNVFKQIAATSAVAGRHCSGEGVRPYTKALVRTSCYQVNLVTLALCSESAPVINAVF